jgi:hypothetical protein
MVQISTRKYMPLGPQLDHRLLARLRSSPTLTPSQSHLSPAQRSYPIDHRLQDIARLLDTLDCRGTVELDQPAKGISGQLTEQTSLRARATNLTSHLHRHESNFHLLSEFQYQFMISRKNAFCLQICTSITIHPARPQSVSQVQGGL